jgi:hypothetical protein
VVVVGKLRGALEGVVDGEASGLCTVCGADVRCRTAICCVNWETEWGGMPPCAGLFCPSCFAGDATYFHSVRPGDGGMCCTRAHALQGGFMCPLCRLRGLLGRELTVAPDDVRLYKCLMMALVDGFHNAVEDSASRYVSHHDAFVAWLPREFRFFSGDRPVRPPAWDPATVVNIHLVYATSLYYTKGRTSCGGGVVYSTAVARVNGIYLRDGADGPIALVLRASADYDARKHGLRDRIGSNPVQNRPLTMLTFARYMLSLEADARVVRARVAQLRVAADELAAHGARAWQGNGVVVGALASVAAQLRYAQLSLLEVVGHRLLMFVMVFGGTRGTEPFRLRFHVWREMLFDEADCLRLGIVDGVTGEPLPQMRLGWSVTKTHQSEKTECVVAATSASGYRILECAQEVRDLLLELGLTEGGLFYDRTGTAMQLSGRRGFIPTHFRPRLLRLRDAGDPGLAGCPDSMLERRYGAWSIRRFAESWLARAAPGVPSCPEILGDLHMGWVVNVSLSGRTAIRYRDYCAADKWGVVRWFM